MLNLAEVLDDVNRKYKVALCFGPKPLNQLALSMCGKLLFIDQDRLFFYDFLVDLWMFVHDGHGLVIENEPKLQ